MGGHSFFFVDCRAMDAGPCGLRVPLPVQLEGSKLLGAFFFPCTCEALSMDIYGLCNSNMLKSGKGNLGRVISRFVFGVHACAKLKVLVCKSNSEG